MDDEMGRLALRAARAAVDAHVLKRGPEPALPPAFDRLGGAFVTLRMHPSGDLRGCIGYPEPVIPLRDAIREAARSACHDPRFPPIRAEELDAITVEVTILTPPEPLEARKPLERPGALKLGEDGLIIQQGPRRGLLLPQVPLEQGWDAEEYLDNLCLKAGLSPGCWRQDSVLLWRFGGSIFAEREPRGEIEKRS